MKKHYHFRLFAVGFSALFCLFFSIFQVNAQGTFRVRFVLDGFTNENADAVQGMHIYFSEDEKLISYKDPSRYKDLSSLPSNAEFPYYDAQTYYNNLPPYKAYSTQNVLFWGSTRISVS